MLCLFDQATIDAALSQPLDARLRALISDRWSDALDSDLGELTHIVVVQAGDDEGTIKAEVGFSPLANSIDGIRYGDAGFEPYWSWLEAHDGWYELILTVGDSGFAFIVLIERTEGVFPALLAMCDEYVADGVN